MSDNAPLHRYWIETSRGFGIGVTAFSIADARALIGAASLPEPWISAEVVRTLEDIDVRSLDQAHVVPNMRPPNLRGVWFPAL